MNSVDEKIPVVPSSENPEQLRMKEIKKQFKSFMIRKNELSSALRILQYILWNELKLTSSGKLSLSLSFLSENKDKAIIREMELKAFQYRAHYKQVEKYERIGDSENCEQIEIAPIFFAAGSDHFHRSLSE